MRSQDSHLRSGLCCCYHHKQSMCSVMSNSCESMNCSLLAPSVHGIFQLRILEWVLPDPGIKLTSLESPLDSLPRCHLGSPSKNTEVGCYSLLQEVFLTQVLKPGFLHCRWILYCLSHQESL